MVSSRQVPIDAQFGMGSIAGSRQINWKHGGTCEINQDLVVAKGRVHIYFLGRWERTAAHVVDGRGAAIAGHDTTRQAPITVILRGGSKS